MNAEGSDNVGAIAIEELFDAIPSERPLLGDALRSLVVRSERRVLALDDDPTGTQTVHETPIVLGQSVDDLSWALRQPSPLSVAVTNSRSMARERAESVVSEVAFHAAVAARKLGVDVSVISRGDSTLRGHFPLETDVLARTWMREFQESIDALIVCPAYVEAGRITVNGSHYVVGDAGATPVGATEFAKDATFGYRASHLAEWMAEKAPSRFDSSRVQSLDLHDIRLGGVPCILEKLMECADSLPVVVDAAAPSDLDVVAAALVLAELAGKRFICQSGPSLLRARAGLTPRRAKPPYSLLWNISKNSSYGLVVVGSHVGLTNQQLDRARSLGSIVEVVFDVSSLDDQQRATAEIGRCVREVNSSLENSDVMLVTSRNLLRGSDADQSLAIARAVSASLVAVVRDVVSARSDLRYLLTKGGITSCDVLAGAVGFARGWVVGQVLDGMVSIWSPARVESSVSVEQRAVSFPLIVFAGNVGGDDGLAEVIAVLRRDT